MMCIGFAIGALSLGVAAWRRYISKEIQDTGSSRSRCVIITDSVLNFMDEHCDWLEGDTVLLIAPSISPRARVRLENIVTNSANQAFKIITCDTYTGLWACARAVKKHDLICHKIDLQDVECPIGLNKHYGNVIDIS